MEVTEELEVIEVLANDEESDVEEYHWHKYISIGGAFQTHSFLNGYQTRMLVISGTRIDDSYKTEEKVYTALTDEALKDESAFQADCDRVKRLKKSRKSNKIIFKVLNLSDYFPSRKSMSDDEYETNVKKMMKDIKQFWPTMIICPFSSPRFANDHAPLTCKHPDFNCHKFDIIKEMLNHSMLQELIIRNENCMFFRSKNIYQNEKCLLSSSTATSGSGLETSISGLLDYLESLSSLCETKVLVISGSHGAKISRQSGFSHVGLLDHEFYEETCELVGVEAQDERDPSIPVEVPQMKCINAKYYAILSQDRYQDVKFLVLNIKHFQNNEAGFLTYVKKYHPHAIVIDWCFSKGGDVANILITSGILAEMWLTLERTSIVGFQNTFINLSTQQREVLNSVAMGIRNGNVKHVLLWGGNGTGKTILGTEIVKMCMGKMRNLGVKYNLHIVDRSTRKETSSLLQNLEHDLFRNEEFCTEKRVWTFNDLEKENGKKINDTNDVLPAIKNIFLNKSKGDKKIQTLVFMDEIDPNIFLKYPLTKDEDINTLDFSRLYFGKDENIYIIGCVRPGTIIGKSQGFEYKIEPLDDQTLLSEKQMLVKNLNLNYRNSREIQFLCNAFKAHLKVFERNEYQNRDIFVTEVVPKNESYLNDEKEMKHVPLGEKPTLLLLKKPMEKMEDVNVETIRKDVLRIIGDPEKENMTCTSLCTNHGHDCKLCEQFKKHYEKEFNNTQKMSMNRNISGYYNYSGFAGCEDDITILHFTPNAKYYYSKGALELLSRAKKKMFIVMQEEDLKLNEVVFKVMLEMRSHHINDCENEMCRKEGWTKKKLLDVKYLD